MDATKKIADHIGSDLGLVMTMLDGLANSIYLQQGDFYGKNGEDFYSGWQKWVKIFIVVGKNRARFLWVMTKNRIIFL